MKLKKFVTMLKYRHKILNFFMSNKLSQIQINIDQNSVVVDLTLSELVIRLHQDMMSDGDDYKGANISFYTNYVAHHDSLLKVTFSKKWRLNLGQIPIDVVQISLDGTDRILGYYKICSDQFSTTPLIGTRSTSQYWLEELKLKNSKSDPQTEITPEDQKKGDKIVETNTKSMQLIGVVEESTPIQYMPF